MAQNGIMAARIPQVIAHRGFSGRAPENTQAAFSSALALGTDGIELDIRFSRDLEAMVIHDAEVDRTTRGRGLVRNLSREQIQALDAGSWFDSRFSSETVPTLEEVVKLLGDRNVRLILEIKPDAWIPPDFVARIMAHFPEGPLRRRLLVISFDHRLVSPRQEWPEGVKRGTLVDRRGDAVAQALQVKADTLALRRNLVNPRVIAAAHQAGLELVVWTVDWPRQIERFVHWGVDAIISNYPDRVQDALGRAVPA